MLTQHFLFSPSQEMGVGRSRSVSFSYEEACKRVPGPVLQRLHDNFKRVSTQSGYLAQHTFTREVLGDVVPPKLAEAVYESFGGGQKGIGYKDLVCGLVLLAYGTQQEKARFIGHLVCGEGDKVTRERLDQLVIGCDNSPPPIEPLDQLFGDSTTASLDVFESWVLQHHTLASFTQWLLEEGGGLMLEGPEDPPTFHETLAARFGVETQVIMDLEKCYWSLKGGNGKFDKDVLESLVCPPLPSHLCTQLFRVLDSNNDGHIDLTELIVAVVTLCGRSSTSSDTDPHNFCFQLFDNNCDGLLSRADLINAVSVLCDIRQTNTPYDDNALPEELVTPEEIADSALQAHSKEKEDFLTSEEYIEWTTTCDLSGQLVKILVEICHVRFGLRPLTSELEGAVVNGYMNRFRKTGRHHGDTVYILPSDWYTQWRVYTLQEEDSASKPKKSKRKHKSRSKSTQLATPPQAMASSHSHNVPSDTIELNSMGASDLSRPPPIDTSTLCVQEVTGSRKLPSLTNEGGRLVRSRVLMEGKDYVVLPEIIWKVFISWYGNAGYSALALPRIVGANGEVDLYPLVLKIYRHTTNPAPAKSSTLPWPFSTVLNSLGFVNTPTPHPHTSGPLLTGEEGSTPQPRRVPYYQAAFPKSTSLSEICETLQSVLRVKAEDLRVYDYSSNEDPVLLEDEAVTLEQLRLTDGNKLLVETRNKDNTWPEELISILKEVIVKDKPRTVAEVKVPEGATGLSNLGNTCFMNSALQCVSNTRPLTSYFKERDHISEINKDNPLGTGGVLAKRYGELIEDLWTGNSKSITPLKFRFTVGRYAPQFTGFQQQDCQELLSFLLDGLHEDLNRVKDKAYRELEDSDGREDSVVAKEAWDYHLSRNQSIIVDLFQGQLKSVVTCKKCEFTSVRFDPFTFLSLPLPMESTVNLEVIVILLDGSQPMRYGLKLGVDDKYRQLKTKLSSLCDLECGQMLLVEVSSGLVRSLPSDSTKIRSVLGGWLYVYEMPPAPPVPPTLRSDSPDEPFRVAKVNEVRRERAMSLNRSSKVPIAMDTDQSVAMETDQPVAMDTDQPVAMDADLPDVTEAPVPMDTVPVHSLEIRSGLEESDGFVFALHRRTFSVDHYFVSSQKTRPVLFGTPLVVPCVGSTPRVTLYQCVWGQVQRLMIRDPPNTIHSPEHSQKFPFVLKLVSKDGLTCSSCPWYKFCTGCVIEASESSLGPTLGYIAVDWDNTALHLKYQSAQERPLDHPSMDSLRVIDTKPIDLYDCFKAFVRQDELGDEESWYCKRCKTHREAVKSLEIWKLPSILIIHLKRFQFFNGRWVKSQRGVTFPLTNLNPTRHTAHNSNSPDSEGSHDQSPESCDTSRDQPMDTKVADQPADNPSMSHEQSSLSCDQPSVSCDQPQVDQQVSCDIEQAVAENQDLYNLFAICCHSGMMGGGHYVSFAKNPNTKWYYFNDSSCKETSEERVVEESPYLLFYELQGLDYKNFRVKKSGSKGQDVGADDDKDYEESLKNLRKSCSIQ